MSAADVMTGYTPVPNSFFDLAAQLTEAELRVMLALTRLITGYNADEKPLSLAELMRATHLSRQGVIGGIKRLKLRGCITTHIQSTGHKTVFHLPGSQPSRLVNEVDQPASQRSGLPLVNDVDYLREENEGSQPSRLVNEVDPLYIRKESLKAAAADARVREGQEALEQLVTEARATVERLKNPAAAAAPFDPVFADVSKIYQDNIGAPTSIIADKIRDAIQEYSAAWVIEAIKKATAGEHRSWAYTEGILRGWKRDGLAQPPTLTKAEPSAKPPRLQPPDPACPLCHGSGHVGSNAEGFAMCACRKVPVTHAVA